jgi:hypothetical protein
MYALWPNIHLEKSVHKKNQYRKFVEVLSNQELRHTVWDNFGILVLIDFLFVPFHTKSCIH